MKIVDIIGKIQFMAANTTGFLISLRHFLALVMSLLIVSLPGLGSNKACLRDLTSADDFFNNLVSKTQVTIYKMNPKLISVDYISPRNTLGDTENRISSAIDRLAVPAEYLNTVLYPASGFHLPLKMFPHSQTFILVDNNCVIPNCYHEDIQKFVKKKFNVPPVDRNQGIVNFRETRGDIFGRLMSSLFAQVPEAQIKNIEFILDHDHNVSLRFKFFDPTSQKDITVFYLVGALGHIIDEVLNSNYRPNTFKNITKTQSYWWSPLLNYYDPRTILLKGSMNSLRQTAYEKLIPSREKIIARILKGGLVVEGASKSAINYDPDWSQQLGLDRARWELTDGDPRFTQPIRDVALDDIIFSYSNKVHIGLYGPQPKSP